MVIWAWGLDIFYSKNVDDKWSNSKNVGILVNSGADDFAFMINTKMVMFLQIELVELEKMIYML